MAILHRNKHDPKHGSRVPQTTRARSIYGHSLLSTAASPPPIWPPSCGCKAGMPPSLWRKRCSAWEACGGDSACLYSRQFLVARNNSQQRTAHRFDEKRWVCCRNKQQEPKNTYPRGTGDKNENPTHARTHTRDGGRNGHGSGGPGTLEHSARGAAECLGSPPQSRVRSKRRVCQRKRRICRTRGCIGIGPKRCRTRRH